MASNAKSSVTEAQQKAIKARLKAWASQPENKTCADCGRSNPGWASVNLGVLVCLECCGQHRNLGVHISKMRSISLDTILPHEERFLRSMSNTLANRWWAAKLTDSERERDIKAGTLHNKKYNLQKWKLDDGTPVPSPSNVPESHPWWKDATASSTAAPSPAAATATDPASGRSSVHLKPAPRANSRPHAAPAAPAAPSAPAAAPPPAPVDLISMDDDWASSDAAPSASAASRQQQDDLFAAPDAATAAPSNPPALDPFAHFTSDAPPQSAQPSAQDPFAHFDVSLSLADPPTAASAAPPAGGGDPFAAHFTSPPVAPGHSPPTQHPSSAAPQHRANAAPATNGNSQWSQAFQAPAAPPSAAPTANAAVDRQKLNAHILSLYSSPAPSQVSTGPYVGMQSGNNYPMQGAPSAYNAHNGGYNNGYYGPKI